MEISHKFQLVKTPAPKQRRVNLMMHSLVRFLSITLAVTPFASAEKAEEVAPPTHKTIDLAIARGDLDDVRRHLIADPKTLNQGATEKSRTPLEQAVLRNKEEIALFLLESGANPNTQDASKRTPLHIAIERNNPALVAALLKARAKPGERDKDGWTPLHHAAAKNQLAAATALLRAGADPMILSELGGTALHEAAASGGREIIQLLLDHKVDPKVKSKQNVTALDLAKEYKNQPAIVILSALKD
jgi:ankyrin repeat protein